MSDTYPQDFREVAHCAMEATFHVMRDDEGKPSVSVGIQGSGTGPAAFFGIYAELSTGLPVNDFVAAGIGAPFEPPPPPDCLPVIVGSDSEGRFGNECPVCSGYFRSGGHSTLHDMTCVYCGEKRPAFHFLTEAQRYYAASCMSIVRQARDQIAAGQQVNITVKPDDEGSAEKSELPEFYHSTEAQQVSFECTKCGEFNDIRGIYGYCSSCGWRQNYDTLSTAIESIRDQVAQERCAPEAAVRNAFSAFDVFCKDLLSQLLQRVPLTEPRRNRLGRPTFVDPDHSTWADIGRVFDIDPLGGLPGREKTFIKMMSERRHIYEHFGGVAHQNYLEKSGDQGVRLGQLIRETPGNVHRLLGQLTRVGQAFLNGFHSIFPVTDAPIERYERHKAFAEQ